MIYDIIMWYLFLCIIWVLVYFNGVYLITDEDVLSEFQDKMLKVGIYCVSLWLIVLFIRLKEELLDEQS